MSLWTPEQERNRLTKALSLVQDTVTTIVQNDEARAQYEEQMSGLFNSIGLAYGWKVCPSESNQLPLVLP